MEFAARWSKEGGDYCVYCLAEAGKRVRYVGISNQRIEKRLAQHLADRQRGKNIYKENWLRSCADRNVEVTIHVVRSGLTAKQAGMIEELLISLLKGPFRLTNTHAGGATGYTGLSEESKAKHKANTKKGWMRAIEKELDDLDMERGYSLLADRELVGDQAMNAEPETTFASRPMAFTSEANPSSRDSAPALPNTDSSGSGWERELVRTLREKRLLWRTEQTYRNWAARFVDFISPRPPTSAGKGDVESFLNSLAENRRSGRATQKQAMNAIFFLMQDALKVDLGEIEFRTSKNRSPRQPIVLTKDECRQLFIALEGQPRLMAQLMYGAGLRLSELLTLRTQHLEIGKQQLRIVGKNSGKIERVAPLPRSLLPALEQHLRLLSSLRTADLEKKSFAGVWLPASVTEKDPKAGLRWDWQWLFPAKSTHVDSVSRLGHRHHFGESRFQELLKSAAKRAGLVNRAPPTVLRRSFAKHLLESGIDMRTVLELLGADKIEEAPDCPDGGTS